MAEKKLNFNAPLMSVRRFSSPQHTSDRENKRTTERLPPSRQHSLPSRKPGLKLEELTEPAAVPFTWEQIPGKPKSGSRFLSSPRKERSITPTLPPGRALEIVQQHLERETEDQNVLTSRKEAFPSNVSMSKLEGSKEQNNEGDSDMESCDAYSDALDTLSPAESCSLNCSVSGLSGSDGPDVKPSGSFSTDPQTMDFMMRRFLPAAKAMTLEPPQYASRKQLVPPVEKVIGGDRTPPLNQYGSNIVSLYHQDVGQEQSEDEDNDYDVSGQRSAKSCGLIPQFWLKNSLALLNPVPGVKSRLHVPKAAHIRDKSQNFHKHAWNPAYKRSLDHEAQSAKLAEIEHKLNTKSNQLNYSNISRARTGSSPYRHLGVGVVAPYKNEAPPTYTDARVGLLNASKEVEDFKADRLNLYGEGCNDFEEVCSHQSNTFGSSSFNPPVEKTLYIDSIDMVGSPHCYSSSSDTKGLICSADEDSKAWEESKGMKKTTAAMSPIQDIECMSATEEKRGTLNPKVSRLVDMHRSSSLDGSHLGGQTKIMEGRQDGGPEQESRSLECLKGPAGGDHKSSKQVPEAADQECTNVSYFQSVIPPPLPKSPSESWLGRTLPSISTKNSFSNSHLGTQFHLRKQAPKTPPAGSKWETIVKSSKSHYDHARYSEELISHVSQQSKT
ncbi:uncharacterized protein LOC131145188 [Malania oleifera]|uniref:uncharacterized protein LOC131145188 n=1 Tax=Malania oleifera TaxID=397392 RepID=UPI0025AEB636|nr:uncharacterized protein LOC131145188 [Malania oleifera]XP_057950301.1 uncharacterized protein LOC131145188 [Malania oleifera]XP_057950302.1 uncharacterized protein LOC131145188 [Malania oleifera]XP_057950303.1 uncharacterized protein LOC131145188 [Malania oleifera]XP_057950304.1 uncharacterized protein LOC131145188 [Malania oleifera]